MPYLDQIKPVIVDFLVENTSWAFNSKNAKRLSILNNGDDQQIVFEDSEESLTITFSHPSTAKDFGQKITAYYEDKDFSLPKPPYILTANESDGLRLKRVITAENESQLEQLKSNFSAFITEGLNFLEKSIQTFEGILNTADTSESTASTPTPRSSTAKPKQTPAPKKPKAKTKPTPAGQITPAADVIRSYLESRSYKFRERTRANNRLIFVLGFSTEKYEDTDGDKSLQIIASVEENGELIRFETPRFYDIYKGIDATDEDAIFVMYQKAANLIAHLQYGYKLVKFWLDPTDGELRMRLDFPIESGELQHSQLDRHFKGLVQFADTFAEKFERYVLGDAPAQRFHDEVIKVERKESAVKNTISAMNLEERLAQLTPEQLAKWKKSSQALLDDMSDSSDTESGGI